MGNWVNIIWQNEGKGAAIPAVTIGKPSVSSVANFAPNKPARAWRLIQFEVSLHMDMEQARLQMVAEQIEKRGLRDPAVLAAMRQVPREQFILPKYNEYAYEDGPLPIPAGQTISQPYVVALMIAQLNLKSTDKVLEIGTGSGYAAAVLSRIADWVYTVERIAELVVFARRNLTLCGYANITIHHSDGTMGWPDHAPYDAIIVAAGGPKVPPTLRTQLTIGGRLVIPIGSEQRAQRLVRITRTGPKSFHKETLGHVRFVPLIGEQGWESKREEAD